MANPDSAVDQTKRLHEVAKKSGADSRAHYQVDRDRILYSSALRRLGEVTQVVSPAEGHVFHNRLTHSLKVAQLARRLAERFVREKGDQVPHHVVLDPEAAEAAALAHDLGHPPFGHAAEEELNECLTSPPFGTTASDGFEGNAQSFRIVTRLAAHGADYDGLNLCRATLDGILKYPHYKGEGLDAEKSKKKYGAYRVDAASFGHARPNSADKEMCLIASIMNHADDVTYSVHDLDDFYRAGLVPLELIHDEIHLTNEIEQFKGSGKGVTAEEIDEATPMLRKWIQRYAPRSKFTGFRYQRRMLRRMSSDLIDEFITSPTLEMNQAGAKILLDRQLTIKMRFLQNLVWRYVIESPRLATQQQGQRRIIRELLFAYACAVWDVRNDVGLDGDHAKRINIVPAAFREEAERLRESAPDLEKVERLQAIGRVAADIVSSLTEQQALLLYRRLGGIDPGRIAISDV